MDLVASSNVIDMLSLPTLNWTLLDQWCHSPEAFTPADFAKLRGSGINVFHPAVAFTKEDDTHEITTAWFGKWNRFIGWHPDYFRRIDTPSDLAAARSENKIGIVLGMQDANHLRTVADLDTFYATGQRLTQITYNSVNRLGSGCRVRHDAGLTAFGADVVARMNSIGMALDVSHCGERTSLDVIAASGKSVLITHSNCRALAPGVARCKSDEVLRAAARSGGVLGITSVPADARRKLRACAQSDLDVTRRCPGHYCTAIVATLLTAPPAVSFTAYCPAGRAGTTTFT
ncbi:MAG TPA: membrane dipeptidase [Bryobacteraceae bacterium]|nr:membrane dipeptidase [Bryobacteraceae bacterium]